MAYGKSSDERMRSEKVGSGSDFWTPPDGESRLRLMPPASEENEDFWFKTATHFNVGPDERSIPCPAESGVSESCFLCRLVKRLGRGDEDEQSEAEDMGARPRYLVSVVDYSDPEAGVQIWPCPVTVFRQLKKFRLNEDEYGDMTDLETGYDIILDRTGTGINTKYDATPARKNSVFPSKELLKHRVESVAELFHSIADQEFELPDLSVVQNFTDDDEMERIYKGVSGGRSRTESSDDSNDSNDSDGEDEPEDSKEPEEGSGEDEAETTRDRPVEEKSGDKGRKSSKDTKSDGESDGKTGRSRLRGRVRDLD